MPSNYHPCWWCGDERASLRLDAARTFVQCGDYSCHTRTAAFETVDDFDGPLEAWNSGNVVIPLTVILPENHFVVERIVEKKPGHSGLTKVKYSVPKMRGIADHLKSHLGPILRDDGVIRPHKFALQERHFRHYDASLISVTSPPMGEVIFEMEYRLTCNLRLQGSKVDEAWLKTKPTRPPVYDRVFQIFAES